MSVTTNETRFASPANFAVLRDPSETAWPAPESTQPAVVDGVRPAWYARRTATDAATTPTASTNDTSWNPFAGAGGLLGALGNLLGAAQNALSSIINQLTALFSSHSTAASPNATAYNDAEVDSVGDPHLSTTGTKVNADGTTAQVVDHYDSMTGHGDLVDANGSIAGGYQVSTTTTTPDAHGVDYNATATVTANGGQDQITYNADGSFAITSSGSAVTLSAGDSTTLAGGETVSRGTDGSLTVTAADGNGGTISTLFTRNGQGVDVKTHAHGLTLGGDAIAHANGGTT